MLQYGMCEKFDASDHHDTVQHVTIQYNTVQVDFPSRPYLNDSDDHGESLPLLHLSRQPDELLVLAAHGDAGRAVHQTLSDLRDHLRESDWGIGMRYEEQTWLMLH